MAGSSGNEAIRTLAASVFAKQSRLLNKFRHCSCLAYGSPISFIVDRFSKRAKYERQVQQARQEATYQKALSKKYNRAMIEEITGLSDERLDDFILFCRIEDRFVEESNEYDIIVAINRCYRDFQRQ